MSDIPLEPSGLSTNAALESLTNIILSHKSTRCFPRNCLGNINFWRNLLHHNSFGTTFCWIPATILILIIIFLFYLDMWMESFILLTAVILNILLVTWDNYLRINELNSRIIFISEKLKCVQKSCDWSKEYFPHLCTPNAPSVSLQWTIRDGKIVNLPTILLTVGDLIIMRPGQQSPVECCVAQKISNLKNIEDSSLSTDEVFSCHGSLYKLEQPSNPTVRHPLPNRVYKVTTPPIVTHLELLKRKFLDRPVSLYNRASHLLFNKFLLQYLLPVTIIIVECICLARWFIIPHVYDSWWYMFVMEPVFIILSLIPYAFPVLWFVINTVGNAFLLSCTVSHQATNNDIAYTESMETQMKKIEVKFSWKYMSKYCFDIICGSGATVTRSGNLLHTLASVTSLCCVDKKGILSWPNPTAEKLFFLRDAQKTSISNLDEDVSITKVGGLNETDQEEKQQKLSASIEILDLTHDNSSAWKLQFDDVYWDRYLTSLKPLGLGILLNTCNSATHEYYSRFCAHITCQSLFSERLVPVTNRRCLCELARLIGFKDSILQKFDTELQLSTYRNVGDIVEMDTKYMKTFFKRRKLKFPFPHMVSVSVHMIDEKKNGTSIKNEFSCSWNTHLFSQGTADIILDCCTDFWNGYDIVPMTLSVRNKILDFYQRSSLTAYCTAFSYRPLLKKLDKSFTNVYVELPRDKALCSSSTNSISGLADNVAEHTDENDTLENFKTKLDPSDCYKAQCNQVFLGMISMQYQALADMVQLIEELEKACIRFVHFSKENELRSRVFSEKMGLESGWNCHISLLDTYNSNVFSESLACLGNFNYARCNFSPTSSNNSSRSYNLLISNEESPYNINVDSVSSNATETRKQRRSVDQSSESDLSYIVEENVPLGFDMSNRSKLPRGIENIRPHLQEVDNVPLLVSLFTDCTPEATREMISIMQENGEVVCVLGSSANIHNVGMFVQADASIAIDPLYPQVCQRESVIKEFSPDHLPMKPIQLSQLLNSIGCSLTIRREDPLPVFHLIMQSRHIMQHVWNCMQFWLCCMAILAVVQMLALICMLPPMFTIEQILWINCVVIPLLSVSLLNGEVDESIMNKATGKDWLCSPNIEIIIYLIWCYGAKLIVAIVSTTSMYGALLYSLCHEYSTPNYKNNSSVTKCSYVYFNDLKINRFDSSEYYHVLFLSRHVTSLMLVLHYVALCTSFLFREYLFWKKVPCFSVTWLLSVFSILIAELVYILDYEVYTEHIFSVDMPVYLLTYFLVSPLLTFIICEIIKVYEIRANKRYHRKVRLMFGTKLGMNSPF